jgi:hypothetical protein
VAYVLDVTKPAIKFTSPKNNAVINAKSVVVTGKTQARSELKLTNTTTDASVIGAADVSGAFSLIIPINAGVNQLSLTATDPAGNSKTGTLSVRKGSGDLAAALTASTYQVRISKLPESVQLAVVVTDPDGRPLANARVTFSLTVPGVPPIVSKAILTSDTGKAVFTTTIPKGATKGQCKATALVKTKDFGETTVLTIINLVK